MVSLWLIPAVLAGAWLLGVVLTRGRLPMWVLVIAVAVCLLTFVLGLFWGRPPSSGPHEVTLGPGFGLMLHALTGIIATAVLSVLNAGVLIVRWLTDRRRASGSGSASVA